MACNFQLLSHPSCMSGTCHSLRIPVMKVSRRVKDVQEVEAGFCTIVMIHFSPSVESVATWRAKISTLLSVVEGAAVLAWIKEQNIGRERKETSCMMVDVAQEAVRHR